MPPPFSSLKLFTDCSFCDGCGADDLSDNDSLKVCLRCKTAAYHDAQCQLIHWKKIHHKECKKMSKAIQPLLELQKCRSERVDSKGPCRCWWNHLNQRECMQFKQLWQESVRRWKNEEYLKAMEGFQESLESIMKLWKEPKIAHDMIHDYSSISINDIPFALQLAERLLFCAYCEADGNQLESCRNRLVQGISIVLECSDFLSSKGQENRYELLRKCSSILNDSWMELMLSYEEEAECRRIARPVANLAIHSGSSCCGWRDQWQRPGYMATFDNPEKICLPVVPREQHPGWCSVLEENFTKIASELLQLEKTNVDGWGVVGSGNRGSGGDDHRVVSAGGNWEEYVLFGTGATDLDTDAPITKSLLRQHVLSAVSLAEAGGGEVIFSRLAPHTHIQAHCGPTNLRWTAHLGLVIPSKESGRCQIRVRKCWHDWEKGKVLLFDDSYEHEIINDTNETRTILLLRLWHPALTHDRKERELLKARRLKELTVEKRYSPPS